MRKLFTHSDLDGVGCAIVGKWAFGDKLDFELCDYDNINEKVKDFILSGKALDYTHIYITDISVNEEVAGMLDNWYGARIVPGGVQLLDHHATAQWLNQYAWAEVKVEHVEGLKSSGTSLFDIYLINEKLTPEDYYIQGQFVEKVRCYDTWDWQVKNDTHAKELNDLLSLLGQSKFIQRFVADPSIEFTESETLLLNVEELRIETYIEKKLKQVTKHKIADFNVAAVYAESNQSILGNRIALAHPDVDFVILVDPGNETLSLRAIKAEIHVGEFAKKYGGGGHPKSAGMPVNPDLVYTWIGEIFDERFQA